MKIESAKSCFNCCHLPKIHMGSHNCSVLAICIHWIKLERAADKLPLNALLENMVYLPTSGVAV